LNEQGKVKTELLKGMEKVGKRKRLIEKII
jgi:hypothetical protein